MNHKFSSIPAAWPLKHGFLYPNWPVIDAWVEKQIPMEEHDEAYKNLAYHWIETNCSLFGPQYFIVESKNFWIVTSQPQSEAKASARLLESLYQAMVKCWGGIGKKEIHFYDVVFIFEEAKSYKKYLQAYHGNKPDIAPSGGCFLPDRVPHIVVATSAMYQANRVLTHEMAHLMVSELSLPLWVNEGIATVTERLLCDNGPLLLDHNMLAEQRETWNSKTIQQFWTGESFSDIELQAQSYLLAEVLALRLREFPGFKDFIKNCDWQDSGRAAAALYLQLSLADIAALFLGPGNWEFDFNPTDTMSR